MKHTVVNLVKLPATVLEIFCEHVRDVSRGADRKDQRIMIVIGAKPDDAESIESYLDEHYPEVDYAISVDSTGQIPDILKDGDVGQARAAMASTGSALWSENLLVRDGMPRLRAKEALRRLKAGDGEGAAEEDKG